MAAGCNHLLIYPARTQNGRRCSPAEAYQGLPSVHVMQAWPMTSKRRNAPALASAPCEGGGGARADFRVAARPLPAVECLNPRGGRATRACPVTLRLPGARAEVSVGRADGGGRAVASRCGKKGERSFGCAVLLRHPGPSGRAGLGTRGAAPPFGLPRHKSRR